MLSEEEGLGLGGRGMAAHTPLVLGGAAWSTRTARPPLLLPLPLDGFFTGCVLIPSLLSELILMVLMY